MMDGSKLREFEHAIGWAVRTSDPDFDDWDAFSRWLDGDPDRNAMYDGIMAAVADGVDIVGSANVGIREPVMAGEAIPSLPPARPRHRGAHAANPRGPVSRRWLIAGGGAIAASLVGLVLVQTPDPDVVVPSVLIEASVGDPRRVALADGSRIDLAGGSRLLIERTRSRRAVLERGRAVFVVRHDEAWPLRVTAGPHELLDAGTVFEVVREHGTVRVSVAEGAVIVDPLRAPLLLPPGKQALLRDGSTERELSDIAADRVGAWRRSSLTYRDAPLAQVADDMSGALGFPLVLSPGLTTRRFTGTLIPSSLAGSPDALAAVLDVEVRAGAAGWELRPR